MKASKPKVKRKTPKRKMRSGRGALWIIALVFLTSAVVRLASGTGAAIAREVSDLKHGAGTESHGAADPAVCQTDEETQALIAALLKREKRVGEKEFLVAQKMKEIEVAKAEIIESMGVLEQAEARLEATMVRSQSAAEDDLAKLTTVYESMKPKEAAALFEAMSPDFAAGFLGRMRPDAAGAVMAGLKPETAYTISVILAGRNANAPSE